MSHAIHLYKYRFISDLHKPLANLMINALYATNIPICDLIVPVPLHKKRLRWRGFNQSELLASHICKNLISNEISLGNNLLTRKRNTKSQMKIGQFKERFENTKNAFFVPNPSLIQGRSILLVDDVATTGSTIFECASVLKKAGASEIFAIVIARQEINKNK